GGGAGRRGVAWSRSWASGCAVPRGSSDIVGPPRRWSNPSAALLPGVGLAVADQAKQLAQALAVALEVFEGLDDFLGGRKCVEGGLNDGDHHCLLDSSGGNYTTQSGMGEVAGVTRVSDARH